MIDAATRQAIARAFSQGDLDEARTMLEAAHRRDRYDVDVLAGLAHALRRQGQLSDALRAGDAALAIDASRADVWLERGWAFEAGGSLVRAEESYRAAARYDPRSPDALVGVAGIAVRQRDFATAHSWAARALALDAGHIGATIALAHAQIADGEAADAATALRAALDRPAITVDERIAALALLGDALDRTGATRDAFAAYVEAKTAFAVRHRAQPGRHRAFVEQVGAALNRVDRAAWHAKPVPIETPVSRHVFLLGYPRSGTTLVENILASAPDVVAIEERPTLREAEDAFLGDVDGLARLAALPDDALAPYRAAYWARVARIGDVRGKMLVDMDPLKGIRLPIIARLFPDARIVIMRRDPRDVVWSCFRTLLAPTGAALDMTDPLSTACHYDAVMRLTDACVATFSIRTLDVRYGDIVGDFDAATQAICDFIGIEWSADLRNFARTASMRGVTTASAGQVERGLYDGGGQWRRYAAELAPVMPALKPWIVRYGTGE